MPGMLEKVGTSPLPEKQMIRILEHFVENLWEYWFVTLWVVMWPFAISFFLYVGSRQANLRWFAALYLGLASYLGGLPYPMEIFPPPWGRWVLLVNRLMGVFAFGYLLAAFAVALNQPAPGPLPKLE